MRRSRPGVASEALPVALILVGMAATLGLVITVHRRAAASRPLAARGHAPPATAAPPLAKAPEVAAKPAPPPPSAVAVRPLPPPEPVEDPTEKALAGLAAQEDEQLRAARDADRKAEALEAARQAAVAGSQRRRRRESLVRGQLDALAKTAEDLEAEADALAMERDALARERDAARAALAQARAKKGGYALMPHRGANGTWQRPVMIECHDGVATLRPKGLSFNMVDMSTVLTPRSSPLVMAVARELIKVHHASSPDGSQVIPYIYFVVRPDGIRPYYEARARLEPLGIAFGYELVDQDWEIDFPDFDDLGSWDGAPAPGPKPVAPGSPAGGAEVAGDAAERDRRGPKGRGAPSGSSDFVWPADRVDGGGGRGAADGADQFLWPTNPPGSAGGTAGAADLAGEPSGRTRPGSSVRGAGPGGAPPRLENLDADRILREGAGIAEGSLGVPTLSGRFGGRGGDGPRPMPRTGDGGLVELGPGALPGLDPADASRPPGAATPTGDGLDDGNGSGPGGRSEPGPRGMPGGNESGSPGSVGDPRGAPAGQPALGAKPTRRPFRNPRGAAVQRTPSERALPALPDSLAKVLEAEPPAPPDGRVRIDPSQLARDDPFGDSPSLPGGGDGRGGETAPVSSPARGDRTGPEGRPSGTISGSPAPTLSARANSVGTAAGGSNPPPQGAASAAQGVAMPSLGGPPSGSPVDSHPRPSTTPAWPSDRKTSVEVPLDLVVACGPDGVVIHPGGYRLSMGALRKDGVLKRDLETIVRNHELIDPMVRPRPRIQFLVEPGGGDTYKEARQKTVLSGLKWPVAIQVAGPPAPRVFRKERF